MLCFAKVIVKNDYQKKGDLVFRPLLRAYNEIGVKALIERGNALLVGMVDRDGIFHELFTGNEFFCADYKEMDVGDIYEIKKELSSEDIVNIQNVINRLIFKKKVDVKQDDTIVYEGVNAPDYQDELQKIKENDEDLKVEAKAYQNGLSLIDPYDKENLNGYRDFLYKVSKLNELEYTKSK